MDVVASNKKDDGETEGQEEILEKFQLELRWCVGQLEAQLSANLSQKQVVQTVKSLKMLTNPKAPVAKKRMVMRSVFGDYRKLMDIEDAKLEEAIKKMTVTQMRPASKTIKGIFYRRCYNLTKELDNDHGVKLEKRRLHFAKSCNEFRFNFHSDTVVS